MLKTRYNDLRPVQEVYFGGNKNIENAQKCMDKIVARINATDTIGLQTLNINESRENEELCMHLQKAFGFANVKIYWDSTTIPNAYTIPGSLIFDGRPFTEMNKSDFKKQREGKYYDEKNRFTIVVVMGMYLVNRLQYTSRETMSILLHEIGHNFDDTIPTVTRHILLMALTNFMSEFSAFVYKHGTVPVTQSLQNKIPILKKLFTLHEEIMYHISVLPIDISAVISVIMNPFKAIFGWLGISGEKFSDKFAATYGYGPDLASALNKMDDPTKMSGAAKSIIYKIPVVRVIYDINETMAMTLFLLTDEHPYNENRINNVRVQLEEDYANPDVPRYLKPEIKKQLEHVKRIQELNLNNDGRTWQVGLKLRKQLMSIFH